MKPVHLPVLLYDGHCPFCRAQVENLKKIAGRRFIPESFQDKGVLKRFPGVTYEACMQEIKLVTGDGRVLGGAAAIFFTLSLAPWLRPLRWIYPLPGLRQLLDWGYARVAENRYRIQAADCPDGTCRLHPEKASDKPAP